MNTNLPKEDLFIKHERFRRVERLYRAGLTPAQIAAREHIPLHVVQAYVAYLR